MSWRDIRPISIGLVHRDDDLLVGEAYDPTDDETFYRPIGGAVEFGETSEEALAREFREELDLDLDDVRLLDVVENRFTFDGGAGHEIVFVYAADPADDAVYDRDALVGVEGGEEFRAAWVPLRAFEAGEEIVYPPEVLPLARRAQEEQEEE